MALRPYEGWLDLVSKVQDNRNLTTDMLNNTTGLLKMRDAVARLMDKCEKITEKMTKMVEELTSQDGSNTTTTANLTEQPKCIPEGELCNEKVNLQQNVGRQSTKWPHA